MANSARKKLIQFKLRSLEEQQCQLHSIIDEQISKVVRAGNLWLSEKTAGQEEPSFPDICLMMDYTLMFICEKYSEIKDGIPTEAAGETSEENGTEEKPSQLLGTQATNNLAASQVQGTEKAISILRDKLETLMDRQANVENSISDLNTRYFQAEDNWTKEFNLVKGGIDKLKHREEEFVKQHNSQMQKLEKQFQTMRDAQDSLIKEFEGDKTKSSANSKFIMDEIHKTFGSAQDSVQKLRGGIKEVEKKIEVMRKDAMKMNETVQDLTKLKSAMSDLMSRCDRAAIGFAAKLPDIYQPVSDTIVSGYQEVIGNADNSFCKDSGIFTAPLKGLYVVSFKHWQREDGEVSIRVVKTRASSITSEASQDKDDICITWTNRPENGDFELILSQLDEGDKLAAEIWTSLGNACLDRATIFSCFRIS